MLAGALLVAQAGDRAFAQTEAPAPESAPSEAVPAEPAPPPPPTDATVRVTVDNVQSASGDVWVALCSTSLSVEGCPYQKKVRARTGSVQVVFEKIPPGVYAVAGYHDLNGNGVFDKFLGVPREPYALSGAAGEKLVPTFEDAALAIQLGDNRVTVRMKRLGE